MRFSFLFATFSLVILLALSTESFPVKFYPSEDTPDVSIMSASHAKRYIIALRSDLDEFEAVEFIQKLDEAAAPSAAAPIDSNDERRASDEEMRDSVFKFVRNLSVIEIPTIPSRAGESNRHVRRDTPFHSSDWKAVIGRFNSSFLEGNILQAEHIVDYVEEDRKVTLFAPTQPPATTIQINPTWGLDRIDQRSNSLNNGYRYEYTGSGVHIYVIDTGVRTTHSEFTGRVGNGINYVQTANSFQDQNGHGTHVAGTALGTTYGVAKQAIVHPVRVLDEDGDGYISDVVKGVNWVTINRIAPAVAVMSLGSNASPTMDSAVVSSIAAGVHYAVAAGNSNQDACYTSPARVASAVTVGATDQNDARSIWGVGGSNWGSCVNIFAPGTMITSAWFQTNSQTNTISGTSMAAPHVAGVMARMLHYDPSLTPAKLKSAIECASTKNAISSANSPNQLLYFTINSSPGNAFDWSQQLCPNASVCTTYSGSIFSTAINEYYPSTSGYSTLYTGTHRAWLSTETNTLDLFLEYRQTSLGTWSTVVSSVSASNQKTKAYYGGAGFYRWRIRSATTTLSYSLIIRPANPNYADPIPDNPCGYSSAIGLHAASVFAISIIAVAASIFSVL